MKRYSRHFRVQAPIDCVAAFHNDAQVLKQLTPPPIFISFNEIQPREENSITDFTMWLGLLPLRWIAVYSDVDSTNGFTDRQVKGPFKEWVHRHTFISENPNTTEIIDKIQANPSNHPIWGFVSRLIWLNMPPFFTYRAWITRRALER